MAGSGHLALKTSSEVLGSGETPRVWSQRLEFFALVFNFKPPAQSGVVLGWGQKCASPSTLLPSEGGAGLQRVHGQLDVGMLVPPARRLRAQRP